MADTYTVDLDALRAWANNDDPTDYAVMMKSDVLALLAAMDAAFITIKYVGDSTVKKLWRECGYDIPRKG